MVEKIRDFGHHGVRYGGDLDGVLRVLQEVVEPAYYGNHFGCRRHFKVGTSRNHGRGEFPRSVQTDVEQNRRGAKQSFSVRLRPLKRGLQAFFYRIRAVGVGLGVYEYRETSLP